jgi:TonB-linked SusC/RagA family outer membrane protein
MVLFGGLVWALGLSVLAGTSAWGQGTDNSEERAGELVSTAEAGYVQSPGKGFSAKMSKTISLRVEGAVLEEALQQIAEKGDIELVYGQYPILSEKEVTLRRESVPVREALEEAIRDTGLEPVFSSSGRLVLVKRSSGVDSPKIRTAAPDVETEPMEVQPVGVASSPLRVQEGTIAGTVTDASSGNPLPGVNVVIDEIQQGASTDAEGNYEIANVEAGTYAVRASFVGYADAVQENVQVQANQMATVDFELEQAAADLDELVVVGYGQEERGDLTGSISSVDAEEIEEANFTSFDQALQGRVAGVNVVQASGSPGAEPIVRIRGRTSVLGNNQPLYVVDGVPIGRGGGGGGDDNPLATIDPSDIESIDVLKDASATAVYGARGSNGVIQITTKGGTQAQRRVNFGSRLGASQMKGIEALNAEQFVEMLNDRAANGGLSEPSPNGVPNDVDTDWQDAVNRTGITQEYNMSVSGGHESGSYRVAGSYLDQEGTRKNSDLRRGSFRLNLQEEVGNLSISPRLSISRVWQDERGEAVGTRDVFEQPPFFAPRQEDGSYTTADRLGSLAASDPTINPLAEAELGVNEETQDRLLGNVALEYQLTDDLSTRVQGGADITRTQNDDYTPISEALNTGNNSASQSRSLSKTWLLEGRLAFDRTVGTNHDISATAVATWEKERSDFLSGSAQGFVSDALENKNLAAGDQAGTPNTSTTESTLISYVGRADYTLMDRYLLTLTGRLDGSSVFGEENKWGAFPSVALGWRISEEAFLQDVDHLSNLKLRFSWGVSGNQAISPYQTLAQYASTSVAFNRERQVGLAVSGIPNSNLNWESTEQFDIGVNASFLDQRYSFQIDAYLKNTRDLLANVPLPLSSGFGTTLRNVGHIQNRGIEFQFDASILTGDFGWSLGGNISANRNEAKRLARGSDIRSGVGLYGAQNIAREGEPIGSFFGLELDDPPLREDGLLNYVDQNEDGKIDADDRRIIGNPHPNFTYGLNTEVRYVGFRLSTFIQGSQGNQVFSRIKDLIGDSMHRGRNQIEEVFHNRWTRENQNRNAEYPAAFPNLNKDASEWQIEDASYLRIKNIRLSYSLPVDNLPVRSANIYVSGQNVLTLTPYPFFSPDSQTTSGNSLNIGVHDAIGYYPLSRTFSFGVDLNF